MLRRKTIQTITIAAVFALALPAFGATDLGNGRCIDEAQQAEGVWAGELSDESCLTAADYAELFSVDNLVNEGIASDPEDNGDGTTTATINGATVVLVSDPLDRPVAANPALEPDAPTVREVLYPRQAFGVHPE